MLKIWAERTSPIYQLKYFWLYMRLISCKSGRNLMLYKTRIWIESFYIISQADADVHRSLKWPLEAWKCMINMLQLATIPLQFDATIGLRVFCNSLNRYAFFVTDQIARDLKSCHELSFGTWHLQEKWIKERITKAKLGETIVVYVQNSDVGIKLLHGMGALNGLCDNAKNVGLKESPNNYGPRGGSEVNPCGLPRGGHGSRIGRFRNGLVPILRSHGDGPESLFGRFKGDLGPDGSSSESRFRPISNQRFGSDRFYLKLIDSVLLKLNYTYNFKIYS